MTDTTTTSALNVRDDLRELADHHHAVAHLDVTPEPPTGRRPPGPRLPPGMQEVIERDEIGTALRDVDEWAGFLARILNDEHGIELPTATPARLRTAGEHAALLIHHEDQLLALAILDDLHAHLTTLRKLAGKGTRRIRTGVPCQQADCDGHLISRLTTNDGPLTCDRDGRHVIPHAVWAHWPHAQVEWVTVEHAARLLSTTIPGVKMRASRQKWRRTGTGRHVRYHKGDVLTGT